MASNTNNKTDNSESKLELQKESTLPLLRKNFILMAIAGVMIVLGFCLMLGGATGWDSFDPDIFSTLRIVVGPTIAFIGFIFMGYAIMYSPRKSKGDEA